MITTICCHPSMKGDRTDVAKPPMILRSVIVYSFLSKRNSGIAITMPPNM